MNIENYEEKVYAGVLGKIIGVYLGRPIEHYTAYLKLKSGYNAPYSGSSKLNGE